MKNKADQQLVEIDKKYSGFIHVSGRLVYDELVYGLQYQQSEFSSVFWLMGIHR